MRKGSQIMDLILLGWLLLTILVAHRWYRPFFFVFAPFVIIVITGERKISALWALGSLTGLFLGNYLGEFMRQRNIAKITADMSAKQIHRLHHHPGVEIWLGTLMVFVAIRFVLTYR